jgi:hypothetical protein
LRNAELNDRFERWLLNFLTETEYRVITVVIDKGAMIRKTYWLQRHPYHYLMKILVEKYVQWLERNGCVGDIMPEMRKGKRILSYRRPLTKFLLLELTTFA